jgi:hypothetical protein
MKLLGCKNLGSERIIQLPIPFSFSNFFNQKVKKNESEVRFKFLQVFSSIDIS